MSTGSDDVRPISAPYEGPDPRIVAPTAPLTGPDPRTGHEMSPPDTGGRDILDADPAPNPDPGFNYGGLPPMTGADVAPSPSPGLGPGIHAPTAPLTGPDPRTSHGLPRPDMDRDIRDRDLAQGAAVDPGFTGGLQPMTAAVDGRPTPVHRLDVPDHPADVRDPNPSGGFAPDPGFGGGAGIQTMAGGGGGGQARTMSGVADPVALNRAGENAQEIAGILRSKGRVENDDTMVAAWGRLGADFWSGGLGLAIGELMELWDQQVGDLVATCRTIGENCTQTAGSYTRTESANEAEMNAVRGSLSDFG
ncbi:hypothetical protein [Streptomyces cavernicola]|uniref:WXG100 family type VII secretion target n=1 Tax=Streptomyces cavernicola TaxID=3043613 RepID=A0ABT6SJL3_9ACTN|nr:hypothetical protein [Streptomyces sp. B-S-A6]MDI3408395.1 hypothetical protein [Streptomyces sp. B-S-A6]